MLDNLKDSIKPNSSDSPVVLRESFSRQLRDLKYKVSQEINKEEIDVDKLSLYIEKLSSLREKFENTKCYMDNYQKYRYSEQLDAIERDIDSLLKNE